MASPSTTSNNAVLTTSKRTRRPSERKRQMDEEEIESSSAHRAQKRVGDHHTVPQGKKSRTGRSAATPHDGHVSSSRIVATKAAGASPFTRLTPRASKVPPTLNHSARKLAAPLPPIRSSLTSMAPVSSHHDATQIAGSLASFSPGSLPLPQALPYSHPPIQLPNRNRSVTQVNDIIRSYTPEDLDEDTSFTDEHTDVHSDRGDSAVDDEELFEGKYTLWIVLLFLKLTRRAELEEDDGDYANNNQASVVAHSDPHGKGLQTVSRVNQQMHGGRRPKATNYNGERRRLLKLAAHIYRCLVSTINAYPNPLVEAKWASDAWELACRRSEKATAMEDDFVYILTKRTAQLRGEIKTKVRQLCGSMYGFEDGSKATARRKNRELAEHLKDEHAFVYQDSAQGCAATERKGLYRHPIIQKAINYMWFADKQDEGVVFNEYFNPITMQTFALVLTVIECCIDEWGSGIHTPIQFTAADYEPVFYSHLDSLQELYNISEASRRMLDELLQQLHDEGIYNAGVHTSTGRQTALPRAALDLAVTQYLAQENDTE